MVTNKSKYLAISRTNIIIKYLPWLLLVIYFVVNLSFLVEFPFVHSDESWLSGFSRTVLAEKTFETSEPFFDLYPRAVHGLRVVFVSLQMIMIKLFGYSIFSVRLLSLIFSTLSLVIIYKIVMSWTKNKIIATIAALVIGSNIQFIMSAHTARQEAPILFIMVLAFSIVSSERYKFGHIMVGVLIGIAIGIHPNSFIIGLGIGLILLYKWINRSAKIRDILVYIALLALWAMVFVGISLKLNPSFIKDYLAFGNQLGIGGPDLGRLESFYYFYYKLFFEIGGTYKLVPIKWDIIILLVLIPLSMILKHFKLGKSEHKNIMSTILMVVGINIAYVVIGRYNQTSILFTVVFVEIAVLTLLFYLHKKLKISILWLYALFACILFFQLCNSIGVISNSESEPYADLGLVLHEQIPEDAKVLANLNLDYHFQLYQLYDYRNLMMLKAHNMTFADYIHSNKIEYIVVFEEMEYIYNVSGKWDILYGPLYYYEDMIEYIKDHGAQVYSFESETYGMRIARYVNTKYPWGIKIYKITP